MPSGESQPRPPAPPRKPATSHAAVGQRREPGRATAAVFALAVHVGFFALIVFGVSWQVKTPTPLSAEIWDSLPVRNVAQTLPPPEPVREVPPPPEVSKPEPPPKAAPPTKADIALKLKKEREEKAASELKQREDKKRADDKKKADDEKQREVREQTQKRAEETKRKAEEDLRRAENEAREAAVRSAREKALSDYTGKIAALIRSRANIPDSVTGQPEIQLRVRLLTNGTVFEANVARPSGNRAFDDAVERAIVGIRQWPVPDNPEILGRQRELLLNIKHER